MDPEARGSGTNRPHVVISVHGIRTYGRWQEELERLVKQKEPGTTVFNYHYGYFSVLAFLLPLLRWITTMRFGRWLKSVLATSGDARVDIVAHSFGTHLVGWSLRHLVRHSDLRIHTVIFAGSVLKPGFRWDVLTADQRVFRVVNECGIKDSVLVWNQISVLLTGMAGRVGFVGGVGERFRNRYFALDHSGYFRSESGALSPDFMAKHWLPLLTSEDPITPVDQRPPQPSALQGIATFALNNTEPIKMFVVAFPFVLAAWWYYSLYKDIQAQSYRATIVAAQDSLSRGLWNDAREFLRTAHESGNGWEVRHLERALDRSESHGTLERLPESLKRAWRNAPEQISYRSADTGGPGLFDMSSETFLDSSLVPSDLEMNDPVAASSDRRIVAAWQKQGLSIRWKVDGRVVTTTMTNRPLGPASVLRFSDDGRWLAVSGENREVWDVSVPGRIEPHSLESVSAHPYPGYVDITRDVIEFDAVGRTVVAWSDLELHIWDLPSGHAEFSSTPGEPHMLPGLSYYARHPWALSFDATGNTMYLSLAATHVPDQKIESSPVTVFAIGTRQAGGWVFKERYVGNIEATALAAGTVDADHFVFSSGNSLYGFIDRETNRTFRLPVPTNGAVGWIGYDKDTRQYITITTDREVFTWNLQAVERGPRLFAAREWGYVYPIPTSSLSMKGVRATLDDDGLIAFGAREYGRPAIFEYALAKRSVREYDVVPSDGADLRIDQWWKWRVEDVIESSDRSLMYALVLNANDIRLVEMGQQEPTAFYVISWERGSGRQKRKWQVAPKMEADAPVTAVDVANANKGFILHDRAAGRNVLKKQEPRYPLSVLLPDHLRTVTFQGSVGRVVASATNDVFLSLQAEEYVDGVLSLFGGRLIVGVSGGSSSSEPLVHVWDAAIQPVSTLGWAGRLWTAIAGP